jgi:lipopolysaccharide export system protein LptC
VSDTAPNRTARYSRFVAVMKIVLPLAALGLLSTLFLFSRGAEDRGSVPVARIEEIAREQRIAAPAFSGMTPDGVVFAVAADAIRPLDGRPDGFAIDSLTARLTAPDGRQLDLTAATGTFDARARQMTLTGLARIITSTGYAMETRGLTADLGLGVLQTDGGLEVRAPYGTLTAGGLRVESGGERLLFTGGVRLLYLPDEPE